jgi:hypothetical protein
VRGGRKIKEASVKKKKKRRKREKGETDNAKKFSKTKQKQRVTFIMSPHSVSPSVFYAMVYLCQKEKHQNKQSLNCMRNIHTRFTPT